MSEPFQPDLYDYAFECDPVPTLNRLRAEDPVHWSRHGFWYLTRYDDVGAVLQDTKRFSSMAAGFGTSSVKAAAGHADGEKSFNRSLAASFNQMDPPDHTRIRLLVNNAFSRRRIEERQGRILEVIGELLGAMKRKPQFDLVTDFAFHLPIIVASEIIGIPTKDRDLFREAFENTAVLMAPKRSDESWAKGLAAAKWIGRYLRDLIEARRQSPQDDLLSALIAVEEEGSRLNEAEMVSAISTIYTAAGTTTERMISSGLFILLSHPEQWAAVKADRSLIAGAVEEILRFHHPLQSTTTNRRATEDVTMRGKTIRAGDTVRVGLGAANRDPEKFPDGDRFDIRRKPLVPILSFGTGPHFCIGSALARFEGQLALQAIAENLPGIRLITTAPVKDPKRTDRYHEILAAA